MDLTIALQFTGNIWNIAQRIKFNILHRSLYLKEWLEYLDSIWETLSQNTHVIHDIALYNFLEKQLNSLGDDR